jgi:hypothetical protein
VIKTKRYADENTPQSVTRLNQRRKELSAKWFRGARIGGRSKAELRAATDLMDARDPKGVSRMLRRLDDAEQRAFLDPDMDPAVRRNIYDGWKANRLVSAEDAAASARKYKKLDPDGQRALDSVLTDPSVRGAWLRTLGEDGVTADDIAASARKYGDLDAAMRSQFRELLADPELREPWVQTVAVQETNIEGVERSLQRIDAELDGDAAMEIGEFATARDMNQEFPDDWNDPFASGSIVTRFKTTGDEKFVRVHVDGNQNGRFLMRESDIEGLSPAEIERKFSLRYTPEYVSDASVPEGTRVNMGIVKANFGGDEGAKQFNLGRDLKDDKFTNKRLIEN